MIKEKTYCVSFKVSQQDRECIFRIAKKAADCGLIKDKQDRLYLEMDLAALKAQGCPIDFEVLLGFGIQDFTHDICGITRHINRATGQLCDCFLPRATTGGGK